MLWIFLAVKFSGSNKITFAAPIFATIFSIIFLKEIVLANLLATLLLA